MDTPNLAAALAAVQAELPEIRKGETATVPTKAGGRYTYTYANLADVSRAILPLLGKHGLAWITMPTVRDGRLVLAYELRHVSGEAIAGEYPLPERGSPQEIGSAITYARRYTLCSVTGVAPDDDDDDAQAATRSHRDRERPPARRDPSPALAALERDVEQADSQDALRVCWRSVAHAEAEQYITGDEAARLRSRITARAGELPEAPTPAGDEGEWPQTATPGGGA